MKARLRHVGIRTRDFHKSTAFYMGLGIGLNLQNRSVEYTDGGRLSILKLDNQIELVDAFWMNHFALTVDDLDSFNLPDKPIFSKETDKVKVCYIQDPDGNVIELVEEKS